MKRTTTCRRLLLCAGGALLASASAVSAGQALAAEPLRLVDASFLDVDAQLEQAEGHPNEEWRLHGLKAYLSGRYGEAIERFQRAAGYADKHSQHYLSLVHWHGQGTAPDRARAYIWSDLAAERGAKRLLAIRERMWAALTPEERARVESEGPAYYEQYGDDVAKPRAEQRIRRFASNMTGSRVGFDGSNIDILGGGPITGSFGNATAGMLASTAAVAGGSDELQSYGDRRVQPDRYWAEQDRQLDPREAEVEVGPIEDPDR